MDFLSAPYDFFAQRFQNLEPRSLRKEFNQVSYRFPPQPRGFLLRDLSARFEGQISADNKNNNHKLYTKQANKFLTTKGHGEVPTFLTLVSQPRGVSPRDLSARPPSGAGSAKSTKFDVFALEGLFFGPRGLKDRPRGPQGSRADSCRATCPRAAPRV